MTYAGRLDPMASGLLLVLVGDFVQQKEKYLGLSKEYKFDVLFGFATDTYDILGRVIESSGVGLIHKKNSLDKRIKESLEFFTGKFMQSYPMYSSKTVAGKPLFAYAREGKIIESPRHRVIVKSLKFLRLRKISAKNLLENIACRIVKVKGDFRQAEIFRIWRKKLRINIKTRNKFFLASFHMKCGSGTYVRAIANDFGQHIGIPSLAFTIKRTKIGNWSQVE